MFNILKSLGRSDSSASLFFNKQVFAILLFASANAAVNPYKNIFGVDVIGLPEIYYSLVILFSGVIITFFSIYFGMKSDKEGSFVKFIVLCSICGILGNIAVYVWPNTLTYFLANCLLLPVFCVLNSLIFGYAAAKRNVEGAANAHHENAALRSTYSMGYVLTLGMIGMLALQKEELIFIWLFSGIMCCLIFTLYLKEKFVNESYQSELSSEPVSKVFHRKNILKLVSVSLVTNMLFTLDATVPFIIVNQVKGEYSDIGIFEACIAVFEVFFIFYWSKTAQRKKTSGVIITGAFIFSVSTMLLSVTQDIIHVYLLIPMIALGAACLISIPIGFLQSLAEGRPGIGSSLLSISFFISSSVSSIVYFIGNYFFDIGKTIFISSAVGLLGLLILYLVDRR
ncbi:MFS transporter [Photobacterium sp. 53610]|uniref:MFS transporter n=1 Tax=Photobacterium sp. 53610 TaxID=3102789 RepID=UPI002ED8DBEA